MNSLEFNKCLKKLELHFEKVYRYYYPRIVIFISKKYNGGKNIAHDVAQEFFMYLMKKEAQISYIRNPTSWVYKCCDNIALKMLKVDRSFVALQEEIVATNIDKPSHDFSEYEDMIYKLNSDEQEILNLIYLYGYNYKEIAVKLNIRYGTVRQKHSRAIKKIKKFKKL